MGGKLQFDMPVLKDASCRCRQEQDMYRAEVRLSAARGVQNRICFEVLFITHSMFDGGRSQIIEKSDGQKRTINGSNFLDLHFQRGRFRIR
jgi:hypothetical protein